MKPVLKTTTGILFIGIIIFISCKKEKSCEGCRDGNKPPIAVAGPDQVITLPTDSISLDGSASNDPDGMIGEWLWKKISGPASFNIINAAAAKTVVKNLVTGVYRFELMVKDDAGLSAKDTVQIAINDPSQPNRPPVANAGTDQTIILPTNNIIVDGSGSTDPDNNITNYQWTKISGPSPSIITNANAVQTQVNNLIEGVYQFELKVTDAGALFSKDTMQVLVNAQTPPPSILPQICDTNRPHISAQLIPFATLSQVRDGMAVVSNGNKILFAGGISASGFSSRVDIYDLISQNWSTAELSEARFAIAAVALGSKIFFGGGEIGDGTTPTKRVDIYDASTNNWSITELSIPRNNIASAAVGNKVIFAGGDPGLESVNCPAWQCPMVDIYDMSTGTWSTASLSEHKDGFSAITANNKIYFAGGITWNGSFFASAKVDIYDNETNTWSTSTLLEGKSQYAATSVGNKIYWAGGQTGNNNTSFQNSCVVEIRDLNNGSSTIQYLFNPATWITDFGQSAVVKNNKIIFYRANGTSTNKFDIYDIATNSWSIGVLTQPIPTGASIISVNNTIYVAGGSANGVLSNQVWKLEF